jgi:alpha-L-arabinofuranosidase
MHDNPAGDDRYVNNILTRIQLSAAYDDARLPSFMTGNVFLADARPARAEDHPLVLPDFDPGLRLVMKADGLYLQGRFDPAWRSQRPRAIATTDLLGRAAISGAGFEQADGTPLRIDTDYLGVRRGHDPFPGPFERMGEGPFEIRVW